MDRLRARAFAFFAVLIWGLALVRCGRQPAPIVAPSIERTLTLLPVTPTPIRLATLFPSATPALYPAEATLTISEAPAKDIYDLAVRFRGLSRPALNQAPVQHKGYTVGDRETFWLAELELGGSTAISATLRYLSPHLYLWVQDGLQIDDEALARSAQEFEKRIYPTNRRYFGTEPSPGVDGDPRLTVLNAQFSGASGYFSSADAYPRLINPYSNQREMFYINPFHRMPGTTSYYETLAHEFQHMIHWWADPNEEAWVNEGASDLAEVLNGYGQPDLTAFTSQPDLQLTTWSEEEVGGHYDASYLFMAYFLERFGADALRALVQHPANGIAGFEAVLAALGSPLTFQDLFADWVIANYLDDPSLGDSRYGYANADVRGVAAQMVYSYPAVLEDSVRQFGTDYIVLYPASGDVHDVHIAFTGTITVSLVPNQAFSGRYQWWSNRGDNSDMTLTRAFDLRGLNQATLLFRLWHDIEDGWDYGYVAISADGGKRWQTLHGRHTTERNPNGESLGHGYTGLSGGGNEPRWVEEEIDLTPFVGQQVLIRFEYITDDAINQAGFCVDDIRIPELGYTDDVETGEGGWVAAGFVRTDNVLPQRFLVQLITFGQKTTVQRLPLDEANCGGIVVRGLGREVERAVLVISGATPYTTEAARYRCAFTSFAEGSR